jgi:hypothetical protein
MARSLNGRDQSSDDPISSFAAPGTSHFDSNAFSFPIDTQLAMNPNYGMSSYPRDLGDPTASINHPVTDHLGGITAASNGSVSGAGADVSMAPPQNPNQASFIPTRESVDESSEHTGDKRKRSKTSRACDECRRKKVRVPVFSCEAMYIENTRSVAMLQWRLMAPRRLAQTAKRPMCFVNLSVSL